mgnify:CR=1 FL=1
MTGFAILQTSASVLQKSAEMAEKDPHGAIITLVSVSVVFCALIILYFAYTFIGKKLDNYRVRHCAVNDKYLLNTHSYSFSAALYLRNHSA